MYVYVPFAHAETGEYTNLEVNCVNISICMSVCVYIYIYAHMLRSKFGLLISRSGNQGAS